MRDVYSILDKSNTENFEYEAMYDDDTKLTFIRSKWLDGSGKIIVRSPLGCKREYYLFQIPKKYQRAIMKMKEEFGYRDNCPHDKNWL